MAQTFVPGFLILPKWSSSKHLEFGIREFEQFTNHVVVDKSQELPEPLFPHQEMVDSFVTCPCRPTLGEYTHVIYNHRN